jgi:cysteine synthase
VPEKYSLEKQKAMAALGGTVVRTPTADGMKGAIAKAFELAAEIPNAYVPQQFSNPANPKIHYDTTGPEIFEQMDGRIDALAIGGGSTGTFVGVARYVKERLPHVFCALIEPQGSVFGGGPIGPHKVEGIGNSFWPDVMDKSLLDEVFTIQDEEAFAAVKELALTEGLLVGGSSGANALAARRLARRLGPGKRIVTLLPDSAERYMSQGILD